MNRKTGDDGLPENHVRLMRILPGCTEDLVLCETRVFSLPLSPVYTAISYAWGPPVAEHAIVLDGRRHLVPKNLWHFLTTWCCLRFRVKIATGGSLPSEGHVEMRNEAPYSANQEQEHLFFSDDPYFFKETPPAQDPSWKPCYSWVCIDALSIDQSDMQERKHEVKIMSHIFGGADEVVVWLGLASTAIYETMSDVTTPWDSIVRSMWAAGYRTDTLQEICSRMYWTRLWVFQELKSAKQVSLMCGGKIIQFAELANTLVAQIMNLDGYEVGPGRLVKHTAATRMVELCGQNTQPPYGFYYNSPST